MHQEMSMSCNTGKFTKRKVIVLSLLGIGVAVGIYFASSTNNPAVAAVVPALTAFAICPVMCAVVGGLIWFMNHSAKNNNKNKNKEPRDILMDDIISSCCSDTNPNQGTDHDVQRQMQQQNNTKISSSIKSEHVLDANSFLSSSERPREQNLFTKIEN
jgi:hypothetical protein